MRILPQFDSATRPILLPQVEPEPRLDPAGRELKNGSRVRIDLAFALVLTFLVLPKPSLAVDDCLSCHGLNTGMVNSFRETHHRESWFFVAQRSQGLGLLGLPRRSRPRWPHRQNRLRLLPVVSCRRRRQARWRRACDAGESQQQFNLHYMPRHARRGEFAGKSGIQRSHDHLPAKTAIPAILHP